MQFSEMKSCCCIPSGICRAISSTEIKGTEVFSVSYDRVVIFSRHNFLFGVRCFLQHVLSISFWKELAQNVFQFSYSYKTKIPKVDGPYGAEVTLNYVRQPGYTSLEEQYFLVSLCEDCKHIFEIGTFDGQTSYLLAKNIPEAYIYTLDLPKNHDTSFEISEGEKSYIDKDIIGKRFIGTPEENRITQLLGDSATFNYGPYIKNMDAIFIDGCHDYVYVRNDTQKSLELVREGGLLIWHDYLTYASVTKYLDDLSEQYPLQHIVGSSLVYCRLRSR